MFRIELRELDRTGKARVRRTIPPDDPLWDGAEIRFLSGVEVDLEVARTVSGQIVGRGRMKARIGGECRRCLAPVEFALDEPLDLVWEEAGASEPEAGDDGDHEDGEVRLLEPAATELDMGEAVREELILSAPPYLLCRTDCKGLCPHCGANRNEEPCDCAGDEIDPRWEALRAVQRARGEDDHGGT